MRSVEPASASASEARKLSPSPTPMTSGLPARAPTTRFVSFFATTAIA